MIQSKMTRSIPESLAPVVERLELEQPRIVTLAQLAEIAAGADLGTSPALIAYRLRQRGWLLATGLRGAWEFAPAAHAGPHSRGGPLIPVLAALALRPELRAALALGAAAWAHGLADRAPHRAEVAVARGEPVPKGLTRRARVVRFDARLEPTRRKEVPVQRVETLLVHLVARPSHVRSWGSVADWLGDLVSEADEGKVLAELVDRPPSVRTRLAYLVDGVWPDLAQRVGTGGTSKVWFGPRGKLRRHSQKWRVADSVLPFTPSELPLARAS